MNPADLGVDHPWMLLGLLPALVPAVMALRRMRSARARLSSVLRSAALVAMVLAIAGLVGLRDRAGLAVVIAIDDSLSMAGAGLEAAGRLRAAAKQQLDPQDRLGVVVFGATAAVDAEPSTPARSLPIESTVERTGSDLDRALALSEALLPRAAERRIVLVTDGRSTRGDAARAARLAHSRDIRVDLFPAARAGLTEVGIEELEVPARVAEGEVFTVAVLTRSSVPQRSTVRLSVDGQPFGERVVPMNAGRTTRTEFRVRAGATGAFRLKAFLDPEADTHTRNNSVATFVQVSGEPRVLHLTQTPRAPSPAIRAIADSGLQVRSLGPAEAPERMTELAGYAAVILDDVAATDLSDATLETLRDFVGELGGGLLALGSERSFAPGGYYQTPVEEALPVDTSIKNERYRTPLSIMLVLDKSGSMAGYGSQKSKMSLAKSASASVIDLLDDRDRIGVVAFDGAARMVAPLGDIGSGREAKRRLHSIQAGGGTDFTPGLSLAYDALGRESSQVRHVLLLTDGHSTAGAFEKMAKQAAAQGITTSTVAVGPDADAKTLKSLARQGDGRYYEARDVFRLPRIFVRETVLAARSHLIEDPIDPQLRRSGALTAALPPVLPRVDTFVATTVKPRAEELIGAREDEPLLAAWRYGLGRSVAFTSDGGGAWTPAWLAEPGFARFWSGLVRWTLRADDSPGLTPTLEVAGDDLEIRVDAFRSNGSFRNFADLRATVFPPEDAAFEVPLAQSSPGRYVGRVEGARWSGALVQIRRFETEGGDGAETIPAETHLLPAPAVVPAELRAFGLDSGALLEIARQGGGRVLEAAAEAFESVVEPSQERLPLRWHLLTLALALLVADVAVRHLEPARPGLTRRKIPTKGKARGAAAVRLPTRPSASRTPRGGEFETREPGGAATATPTASEEALSAAAGSAGSDAAEEVATEQEPAAPAADYTERLLAAKRRRRRGR